MPTRSLLALCLLAACGGHPKAPATTASTCPPSVSAAVTRAYPTSAQQGCKAEHEDGKDIFEVKIKNADGAIVELDVAPDGTILQAEEVVPAASLPEAVAKAFAAKYPGAQPARVERVTVTGKPAMFEIAFSGKAATFSETGDFVEEEQGDEAGEQGDKD